MDIGIISYLSPHKDEAYIKVISKGNISKKINFRPSMVPFNIQLSQLLVITENGSNPRYSEFNLNDHLGELDIDQIKNNEEKISMAPNRNIAKYLLENDLYSDSSVALRAKEAIEKLIDVRWSWAPEKVNIERIDELIDQYKIGYEEGRNKKAGDYVWASIKIYTLRPSTLPNGDLDNYLNQLLPNFNFTLASGEDSVNLSTSNLLKNLKSRIGEAKVDTIRDLCSLLTENIQSFAKLIYNERDHASSLYQEYKSIYSSIVKKFDQ